MPKFNERLRDEDVNITFSYKEERQIIRNYINLIKSGVKLHYEDKDLYIYYLQYKRAIEDECKNICYIQNRWCNLVMFIESLKSEIKKEIKIMTDKDYKIFTKHGRVKKNASKKNMKEYIYENKLFDMFECDIKMYCRDCFDTIDSYIQLIKNMLYDMKYAKKYCKNICYRQRTKIHCKKYLDSDDDEY